MQRIVKTKTTDLLTAADFSVLVSGVPPGWSSTELRAFFERFGEVVHVGVSLNNRELILQIQAAKRLKELHTEASLNLLNRMAQLSRKEDIERARREARDALAAVESNQAEIKRLMKQSYRRAGHACLTSDQ